MRSVCLLLLACVLSAPALFAGKLIVNNDEWTMSNGQPNAGAFAANIANWFSPGGPGTFLVYSNNFGLDNATFTGALTGAGHSVTVNTAAPFTLPDLSAYDGVFLGGYVGAYDASVLTSYVNGGGNVYLMGGTGGVGGEDTIWDGFLGSFGFEFGPSYNGITVTQPITSLHPIFAGIGTLYFANGNSVLLAGVNPNASILETFSGQGLIGVYEGSGANGAIPEPSTLGLCASSLLGLAWAARRRRA